MSEHKQLYLGKAGQAAVMSEFLVRGYNVATPEVDTGDDLFVVHDERGDLWRIQVKSTSAIPYNTSEWYASQFLIPVRQLNKETRPDLIYVFCVRHEKKGWAEFIVIPRKKLYDLRETKENFGSPNGQGNLKLYMAFSENDLICSRQSLQGYRNWNLFPNRFGDDELKEDIDDPYAP